MKREGRQHGVVRSYPILPTPLSRQRRYVKTVDSASVAGLFTKVSSKPTNHSKFTGKCGSARCLGCNFHPVCKSKDKAKGSMKLRANELIGCPAGTSAIEALAYLARHESCDELTTDDYDDNDDDDDDDDVDDDSHDTKELIRIDDEDDGVGYYEVGLCWGDGEGYADEHGDDEWYLVGHFQ